MVRTPSAIIVASALLFSSATWAKTRPVPAPPVIRTVVEYPKERFGDWAVSRVTPKLVIASVKNDAGYTFGSMCNPSGCFAFFNPQIPCKDDSDFAVLINAPGTAFNAEIKCMVLGDINVYTLPLEGSMADAMSIGGVLGIAFPMQSGEFRVARFSLTGAARATARAQQMNNSPTQGTNGTKPTASVYSL